MAFSIPQTIYPTHTLPLAGPTVASLNVGSAVKDMPDGTETKMKTAYNQAVTRIKEKFDADTTQYDKDFSVASQKATEAEKIIGNVRIKKAIAITLLVASILAVVGVGAAMVLTGTWPIAFIAIPFLISIVPTSYFTDIFRKKVSNLEDTIQAPRSLVKPILQLPVYNPKKDLDLQQSRIDVQNNLASMTFQQIAESGKSNDEIVSYALLDRVTPMNSEKRPAFYAKSIQLINGYGQIVKEHQDFVTKAENEFDKIRRELNNWKQSQDSHISSQEWAISEQERTQRQLTETQRRIQHRYPVNTTVGSISTLMSKWDLERRKIEVAVSFAKRNNENQNWHQATRSAIDAAFNHAVNNIEHQYADAKIAVA